MPRRSFLRGLTLASVLLLVPDHIDSEPTLPVDGQLMFWIHIRQAIKRGALSIEQAWEHVVEALDFVRCSPNDANRASKLASEGYYELDTIPVGWRETFDRVERESMRRA